MTLELIEKYWCPECNKRQPIDAAYAVSGSQVCCMICGYKWPVDFDFTWECLCGAQAHIVEYGTEKERILRCNVCGRLARWPSKPIDPSDADKVPPPLYDELREAPYSTPLKSPQASAQVITTEVWRCACGATEVSTDTLSNGQRIVRCSDVCGKPLPYQAVGVPREYPEKLAGVRVRVPFARCVYCFEEALVVARQGERVVVGCLSCLRRTEVPSGT